MNASSPAQPPTTANNTINAKGNLPTGAQIPTLRPFAAHAVNAEVNVPAGNEDIIVGDYNIDGVVGIVCEESRWHAVAFYKVAIPLLKKKSQSNQLMTKSKFDLIKEALLCTRDGDESIAELWNEYPSNYKWNKAFLLNISFSTTC